VTKNHDELRQHVGGVDQHVTVVQGKLTRAVASVRNAIGRIEHNIGTNGHIKVSKEWRDALFAYKWDDGEVKDEAKKKLMELVGSGIEQVHDAIDVSLAFIRDEDEAAKALGLRVLAEIVEDPKKREKVLQFSTLSVILVAARDLPSGAVKEYASDCLNNLVALDRPKFFKLWEEIDCAITDDRIIRRIIKLADADDRALGILAKLDSHDEYKPVIARMGGVAAMVDIYTSSEEMFRAGSDTAISTKVLLSIDVLGSLATDEEC
jgi:hypothetical protein